MYDYKVNNEKYYEVRNSLILFKYKSGFDQPRLLIFCFVFCGIKHFWCLWKHIYDVNKY